MSPQYLSPGVYVEEVDRGSKPIEGVGTAVAGFIGFAAKGPLNKPTFVANWTQFANTFGGFMPGAYLAHAVFGYFNNGGGSCYVVRLPSGEAHEGVAKPMMAVPAKAAGAPATLRAAAREEGSESISLDVADAGDDKFNLTVRRGAVEEKFEGLSMSAAKGAQNAVETVNKQSKLVMLEDLKVAGLSVADRTPVPGTYALAASESKSLVVTQVAPDVYQGNVANRSGLGGFEAIDDITMIAAPDLMSAFQAGAISREGVKAVQLAMIAHCENMKDRVAILNPLPDL
ncbi:MAG: phage tail sheath family protein, partial [Thermoflexales bacterium]|nr:phage tail sheath family protein [Thermoflexales bacterium]